MARPKGLQITLISSRAGPDGPARFILAFLARLEAIALDFAVED